MIERPTEAPGRAHREGLTLLQIADMFRDEDAACRWVTDLRWPDGPHCPDCGSWNVQDDIRHRTMTHRCRDCPGKPYFSLRKGTVMESSKLPYRIWAVGIYLFSTNLKGISSMKLHRELGIGQKAAWFMLHRLREAADGGTGLFTGPVEVDETYVGGKRKSMSNKRRKQMARYGGGGTGGKTAVAGARDRGTNLVEARVINSADKSTLHAFVEEKTAPEATIYTDDALAYRGMSRDHEVVKHSVKEYVRGQAHTNGIESFWSMLKRGYVGTYHKMSPKHLDRYVAEFQRRHNDRDADTIEQMEVVVAGMEGRRLRYRELTADNGLDSGARRATAS